MWGREMRAGLAFVLLSLLVGGAFREWRRAHETRFADLIEALERRAGENHGGGAASAGVATSPAAGAETSPVAGAETAPAAPRHASRRTAPPLAPAGIDVDRADAAEFERLPGIGPALAARIVADRVARGPFRSPEALLRVRGIGPRTLSRIRVYLAGPAAADSGAPNAN